MLSAQNQLTAHRLTERRGPWLWTAGLAAYAFLYLPLTFVVAYSFNDSRLNAEWVGFTLHWYRVLLEDEDMLVAAGNSLLIATVASLAATVLGTMAGIAMHRYKLKVLTFMVLAPVAMPEILLGVSLLLFFIQVLNLTLGLLSIVLAHITFSIGFVAVIVQARLAAIDESRDWALLPAATAAATPAGAAAAAGAGAGAGGGGGGASFLPQAETARATSPASNRERFMISPLL